jgi:hypothetical protein
MLIFAASASKIASCSIEVAVIARVKRYSAVGTAESDTGAAKMASFTFTASSAAFKTFTTGQMFVLRLTKTLTYLARRL